MCLTKVCPYPTNFTCLPALLAYFHSFSLPSSFSPSFPLLIPPQIPIDTIYRSIPESQKKTGSPSSHPLPSVWNSDWLDLVQFFYISHRLCEFMFTMVLPWLANTVSLQIKFLQSFYSLFHVP